MLQPTVDGDGGAGVAAARATDAMVVDGLDAATATANMSAEELEALLV